MKETTRKTLLIVATLLATSCASSGTKGDAAADGLAKDSGRDALVIPFSDSSAPRDDAQGDASTEHPLCEEPPPAEPFLPNFCCPIERQRARPTAAVSTLDLSAPETLQAGTCAFYDTPREAIFLPDSVDAYPLKVVLPALTGADPACDRVCNNLGAEEATAFGLSLDVPDGFIGGNSGRALGISVAPPWYFVSGGRGEAYPWPCLGGYQEFGVRSCVTLPYGGFGFATADANAPSVEVTIEVVPSPLDRAGVDYDCCPYPPR